MKKCFHTFFYNLFYKTIDQKKQKISQSIKHNDTGINPTTIS